MSREKDDARSNYVRLSCGHMRNVTNKSPKPGIGDLLYCMTCDDWAGIIRREIYNG